MKSIGDLGRGKYTYGAEKYETTDIVTFLTEGNNHVVNNIFNKIEAFIQRH